MKATKINYNLIIHAALIIGLGYALLAAIWLPEAQAALPPRPQPTSVPPPDSHDSDSTSSNDNGSEGGYIELQMQSAQLNLWTIVQWEDAVGNWHNVDSWQGTLDEGNRKIWWVAKADFDKGPFRWTVLQGQAGKLLAASESFHLPHIANERVRIILTLTP